MKLTIFLISLFIVINLNAQDTTYYKFHSIVTEYKDSADYYGVCKNCVSDSSMRCRDLTFYYMSGQIKQKNYCNDDEENFIEWYQNGKIRLNFHYLNNKRHGDFKTFWRNGQLKRFDKYQEGQFLEGTCWDSNGIEVPYYKYEITPSFPGGSSEFRRYISSGIEHPKKKKFIKEGKIIVQFRINRDGRISDVKILQGLSEIYDHMVIDLISNMPEWTPAFVDGEPISFIYKLPLNFQ